MAESRKKKQDAQGPAEVCEGCELRCTLDQAKRGDKMIVTGVDDDRARIHAIRFGMGEGACVQCVTKIPAGPIVLRSGRQEIAVGRELAKRISVRQLPDKE
jgi:Fe2+ transport system protein FeoA